MLYIVTKYVWKSCVDLGNKVNPLSPWDNSHHCSTKQSKTLAPDDLLGVYAEKNERICNVCLLSVG